MAFVRASTRIALLLALLGTAVAVPGSWGTIKQLTFSLTNSNLPIWGNGVAAMGGCVHIAYSDQESGTPYVYYLRSTDGGANFEPPVVIEQEPEVGTFSLVADSSGNVHLIVRRSGGTLWYRRSTDNGQTWQDAVQLRDLSQTPLLLTSGARNVHIIDIYSDNNLYIISSTDGGSTWGDWQQVASRAGYNGLCGAVGGSSIHLAFAYGGSGTAQTYYTHSLDYGQTWSDPKKISTTNQTSPVGIWADNQDHVYLAFSIYTVARNFRRSVDNGATWMGEQTLKFYVHSIATTAAGPIGAVGVKNDDHVLFMRSTDFGATWGDTLNISGAESGVRAAPSVIATGGTNAHVVWNSRQTGNVDVYYRPGQDVIGIAEGGGPPARPRSGRLAPNPARATVSLTGSASVRLYDRSGVCVRELVPGANNITRLARGVYFVRDVSGAFDGKFVKLD